MYIPPVFAEHCRIKTRQGMTCFQNFVFFRRAHILITSLNRLVFRRTKETSEKEEAVKGDRGSALKNIA